MHSSLPDRPEPQEPEARWKHQRLYARVREATASLPFHFQTDTFIEGISATDIFTLNSALGATIEEQVVTTLNRLRTVWDPDGEYSTCGFTRQSQCFPDVLLRDSKSPTDPPIMGIELKGWYLLSKEAEPSARFRVTPGACAPADLLVVCPWALQNVLSGSPKVFPPFITLANYAARMRNFHWQHVRNTKGDTAITSPPKVSPYPAKGDVITDQPASDSGGNFGRFSRSGIMDDFLTSALQHPLCGIPARAWLDFFRIFTDTASAEEARRRIEQLRGKCSAQAAGSVITGGAILDQLLDWVTEHL